MNKEKYNMSLATGYYWMELLAEKGHKFDEDINMILARVLWHNNNIKNNFLPEILRVKYTDLSDVQDICNIAYIYLLAPQYREEIDPIFDLLKDKFYDEEMIATYKNRLSAELLVNL